MDESWDGAYEVIRLLKEDGTRQTWLLEERAELRRRFICKRASGPDTWLLRREYEIMKALPGSARTLEFREEGGVCRLLRDYFPGTTLAELVVRDGPLSGRETAELGVKLCGALGTLHAMTPPVIHRDLKPENILITETGRVRLIDLGAARTYKPGRAEDTACLGTRGYAAPEQYGSGQTDVRTDVFALGKVMSYALAGEYVDAPPRLAGRDRSLERVLRRCCAYDPARRWQGMEQLKKALERYLARRALPGRTAAAAICAVLVLCGGSLWAGYALGLHTPAPAPAAAKQVSGWDPFRWEPDVAEITHLTDTKDWPALAAACENLVSALAEDPLLQTVEPLAFWEMDEAALADYYQSRQGYEFIADNLAYGDGLTVSRLGTYQQAMPRFAMALRSRIDYIQTDEAGHTQPSALNMFVVQGDDRNIDGCVIEILDELNRALDETPAP